MLGDRKTKFRTLSLQTLAFAALFLCAPLLNTAKAQDITSGLVGYWKMDETEGTTISDSAGTNDASPANGLTITGGSIPGKISGAINLSGGGSQEAINLGDTADLRITGAMTLAGWFYFDTHHGPYLISKWTVTNRGYDLSTNTGVSGPVVEFRLGSAGSCGGYTTLVSTDELPIGEWVHVAGVYDPSNALRIYINGTMVAEDTTGIPAASCGDSNQEVFVGCRPDGTCSGFDGGVDDIRIYSRALTDDDITALYNYTSSLPPCNTDDDSDGEPDYEAVMLYNNDEKVMQYCNGTEWISVGKAATCKNIGDTCADGTIYAGSSPDGDIPMYIPASDQSNAAHWGAFGYVTGSISEVTGSTNSADIYTHVQAGDGDNNPDDGNTPNASVLCEELETHNHDDWYLPAKDELNQLYENLVDQNNDNAPGGPLGSTYGFNITGSFSSGYYWSSTEDNLNGASSQNFNGGGPLVLSKGSTLSVRCVRKQAASASSTSCTSPEAEPGTMFYNRAEGVLQYCNGANWINMGPKTATGGVDVDDALSPDAPTGSLIGHWPLNSDANDAQGSNNGTVSGGASYVSNGKFSGAIDMDGSDDIIDAGSGSSIDDIFSGGGTISAWISPQSWGEGGFGRILEKATGTLAANGFSLTLNQTTLNPDYNVAFFRDFSSGYGAWTTPLNSITLNQWNHVVVVYDEDDANNDPVIYINGQNVTVSETNTPGGTANTDAGSTLTIGNSIATDRTFDGLIDDVRIYGSALSEEDVTALYKSNSLAGHWKLDETEGTDATDSSDNGNTGTVNGTDFDTSAETGRTGGALTFDGVDDWVSFSNDPNVNLETLTISMWIKPDTITSSEYGLSLIENRAGTGNSSNYEIAIDGAKNGTSNDGKIRLGYYSSGWRSIASSITPEVGQWQHIAMSIDSASDTYAFYLNGAQTDTGSTPVDLDNTHSSLTMALGRNDDTADNDYYDGQMDDVRIYNRALSLEEIQDLYYATGGDDSIAISGCDTIGQTCNDGTIYAGTSPDGGLPMYTTPADQSNSSYWGIRSFVTGFSTVKGSENSAAGYLHVQNGDGQYNPDDGYTPNAFVLCEELEAHEHTDWYLPAEDELTELYTHRNTGNLNGSFAGSWYWSSTETNTNYVRVRRFSSSGTKDENKHIASSTRCVRKGDKNLDETACSNPDGVGGQMFYNNDEDIMQYCNGEEWIGITGTEPGTIPVPDTTDPVWTTAAGTVDTIEPSAALSVTVTATDDSGTVTYSKDSGAGWISVNSSTGELTGTAPGSATTDSITVTATDPSGNTTAQTFDVVVDDPCKTGVVGTQCDDDAIYAGELLGIRLYAAPEDEGTFLWGGHNEDDSAANSNTDGLANTNALVGDGHGHPAAQECADRPGADWYLPAKDELDVLNDNKAAIDASANQSFQDAFYWSSTEVSTTGAWFQTLDTGGQFNFTKTNSYRVRCVRR